MQRWQSEVGQDPRRATGDAPNPGQFTDVVPALPVFKVKQKAKALGAVVYLTLLAIYAALIVVSAVLIQEPGYLLMPVTCSCNVVLLAVTGVLQRHLVSEQRKEKRQGYIEFSEHLNWIIHLPFPVFSFGTAGILLMLAWQPTEREDGLPPLFLIRVLVLLEVTLTGIIIGVYLRMVFRHHAAERNPDVMESLYSALNPPVSLFSLRYNDGSLAEQQATLLHYQQDNLRYLSEEILRLQETLSKYERSQDDSTPQVDMVHLLAAREQELRAVTAERDQLLGELRLTRTLIAERDADVKQIQATNHQYIAENQRVRAMLDEWSTRTAKLEIALEAEQLSNLDLQKRISVLRQHSVDLK